jgi:hypothetical protein
MKDLCSPDIHNLKQDDMLYVLKVCKNNLKQLPNQMSTGKLGYFEFQEEQFINSLKIHTLTVIYN